jgi:hypothetical protein
VITFDIHLAKKLAKGTRSDVRNCAYRLRQGFIGAAQSCLCAWPLVRQATSTEHDERCPAHRIIESMVRAEEGR